MGNFFFGVIGQQDITFTQRSQAVVIVLGYPTKPLSKINNRANDTTYLSH